MPADWLRFPHRWKVMREIACDSFLSSVGIPSGTSSNRVFCYHWHGKDELERTYRIRMTNESV
jgi:hypothetical protein